MNSAIQLHQRGMQKNVKRGGKRSVSISRNSWLKEKTVTQACRPTALKLKRTDERINNCTRILLDLSSPASSESVMFLSRTGAGGLETRLTEAIGERICLPFPRYKSELIQSLKETLVCERCWKISDWKRLTVLHVSTETVNRHSPLSYQ